jgi:RNA polymerase sigma factor (sigma-70 family)
MRLMENNYAIVAKFRGHSSFRTYLTVVITNLFRDYRNARWGRWRASAEARRLGPTAIRLEACLYRDGYPLAEAIEAVWSAMGDESTSRKELRQIAMLLEPRAIPREVGDASLVHMPAPQRADIGIMTEESFAEQEYVAGAVSDVLATLPVADQVIYRMKFCDAFTVAEIARTLKLPQKPMYRRLEKLLLAVREGLESRGIDRARAMELLTSESWD